ncbi:MAG TPA: hypothetical protein DCM26_05460 [Desulfotomaculum sp.]|nr:hypothetical protein [Desulfotomaculum sp.]
MIRNMVSSMGAVLEEKKSIFVDLSCSYVPVEIIHAAGLVPRRLLPPAPKETGLLPHNSCSYARACVEHYNPAPVVFTVCCDGLRRCYDVRKSRGDNVFILDLPRQVTSTCIQHYREELLRFAQWLAVFSGRPVCETSLERSMALYRDLRLRLKELQNAGCSPVGFNELVQITLASAPEDSRLLLEGIHKTREISVETGSVLLTGAILPDAGILRVLEENNAAAVVADFCIGDRYWLEIEYPAGEDRWLTLARAYLEKPPCPRMAGFSRRFSYLRGLLDRTGAHGVILYGVKFCDHSLYDVPLWRSLCSERGIPFLYLEGEYRGGIPAQFHTRIQAFLETI